MSSPIPSGMSFSTTEITPWFAMTASMRATVVVCSDYGVDEGCVLELDDDDGSLGGVIVADGMVELVDGSGIVVVAGTVVVDVVEVVLVVVVVVVASTIR